MKKEMKMKELNKKSSLYVECLKKGKEWMKRDSEWLKKGWGGYKKRISGEGGWSLFKNGELWRDGFDSEVSVWRSLIGGIDLFVNMWDWGWEKRKELGGEVGEGWDDERIYEYMIKVGEECGVKVKVERNRWGGCVEIEKKDYLRLRKEVSKDLGWEIRKIE